MKSCTYSLSMDAPFKLALGAAALSFRYGSLIGGQGNEKTLEPRYRFAMGRPYTVRGHDGKDIWLGPRLSDLQR